MKITNAKTIEVINAFESMGNKALPLKLSYAIAKNREKLTSEIYKPYEKSMAAIQDKYALRDENGEMKRGKDGNILCRYTKEFQTELQELLDIENDFTPHTISEAVLDDCEKERYDALTPKECAVLLEYFVEAEEEKE